MPINCVLQCTSCRLVKVTLTNWFDQSHQLKSWTLCFHCTLVKSDKIRNTYGWHSVLLHLNIHTLAGAAQNGFSSALKYKKYHFEFYRFSFISVLCSWKWNTEYLWIWKIMKIILPNFATNFFASEEEKQIERTICKIWKVRNCFVIE